MVKGRKQVYFCDGSSWHTTTDGQCFLDSEVVYSSPLSINNWTSFTHNYKLSNTFEKLFMLNSLSPVNKQKIWKKKKNTCQTLRIIYFSKVKCKRMYSCFITGSGKSSQARFPLKSNHCPCTLHVNLWWNPQSTGLSGTVLP